MRKLDLAGRTVLITGACGGLGTALSNALRSKGAKIAVLDLRQEAAAAEAERLGGGTQARGWAVDVRDLADLERTAAQGAISGCRFTPAEVSDDGTVTITVRPKIWFDLVDFAPLPEGSPEAPTPLPEDSTARIALALGLGQLSAYSMEYAR